MGRMSSLKHHSQKMHSCASQGMKCKAECRYKRYATEIPNTRTKHNKLEANVCLTAQAFWELLVQVKHRGSPLSSGAAGQ